MALLASGSYVFLGWIFLMPSFEIPRSRLIEIERILFTFVHASFSHFWYFRISGIRYIVHVLHFTLEVKAIVHTHRFHHCEFEQVVLHTQLQTTTLIPWVIEYCIF